MDTGEMWKEHKKERRAKKEDNHKKSIALLEERGIKYRILSKENVHYRVGDWDFWPSTGKFYNQKTGEKGRGVFNLIKKVT